MNFIQILEISCETPLVNAIISGVRTIFTLIQWGIPILLIVLCTIDMFKAVSSGDEKKTKEAQKTSIRRLIYAVVAFLIPWIIGLVFGFIGNVVTDDSAQVADNTWKTFFKCWNGNSNNLNNPDTSISYGTCTLYDNDFKILRSEANITNEECTAMTADGVNPEWIPNK